MLSLVLAESMSTAGAVHSRVVCWQAAGLQRMTCLTYLPCLDYPRHAQIGRACCTWPRLTIHIHTRQSCDQASSACKPLTTRAPDDSMPMTQLATPAHLVAVRHAEVEVPRRGCQPLVAPGRPGPRHYCLPCFWHGLEGTAGERSGKAEGLGKVCATHVRQPSHSARLHAHGPSAPTRARFQPGPRIPRVQLAAECRKFIWRCEISPGGRKARARAHKHALPGRDSAGDCRAGRLTAGRRACSATARRAP